MKLNLLYLLAIRGIVVVGLLLAMTVLQRYYGFSIPLTPVVGVISALAVFTLISWWVLRNKPLRERIFLWHLVADLLALSLLVYFTGGSSNPFVSLFILPVIFAAASLRVVYTGLITCVAILSYTLLMFFFVPLEQLHEHHDNVQLHVWGMWYGFIISALLVGFFVTRIARSLRQREHALALAREEAIQANQLAAMGTLAAGTAHELGTPLSTVAILCKELEHEYANEKSLLKDLGLVREQVERCKSILSNLAADAGQLQADSGHPVGIDEYLRGLLDDWQNLRSGVNLSTQFSGTLPAPLIVADKALSQSIVTVLNNAADASATKIDVESIWSEKLLTIRVRDDGSGLSAGARSRIGKEIYSSKSNAESGAGMGIGLFLAHATLKRLGGLIEISNDPSRGTWANIELPLDTLLAGVA